MRPHTPRSPALAACLALLAGCASNGGPGTGDAVSSPDARTGDPLVDSLLATYEQDLRALADPDQPTTEGTPVSSRSGVFIERTPAAADDPTPGAESSGVPGVAQADPEALEPAGAATVGAAPNHDGASDVPTLARQLAAALRARALTGVSPYEDLSRVAMLEAIAPGVLEGLGDSADADSPEMAALLAPSERDALRAARRTARSLAASESADPSLAAEALIAAAATLEESQALRIRAALLCRRVDGFARYDRFESSTFLAGRVNPVIVYAEVDRFRQEPVGSGGSGAIAGGSASLGAPPATTPARGVLPGAPPAGSRFAVRLTQSLNLYFSDGGLLVWRRAPQTVTDFSSDRFRDFYIIDTIHLPATLAAGSYSLKVVIRDEATGQQAERIIPITLVADAGLAQGG